jgi:serine/threonine protein phosphatase PrpC
MIDDHDETRSIEDIKWSAGSTAVLAVVTKKNIFVASCGDSRCILVTFQNSEVLEIKPLTLEHKAVNPTEKERIKKAGGKIEDSRIEGFLIVSRSLGVFRFKNNKTISPEEQMVIAHPDVMTSERVTDA